MTFMLKRLSFMMAVIMVVVMSFGSAAFASDWLQFQNDAKNSGIYTGGSLPTSVPSSAYVSTQAGGWMGIDTPPIFAGNYAYVFPITTIYEVYGDCSSVRDYETVESTGGFQLCTPASDGSSVFVGINDMINQTTNKDFATDLSGWTTGSSDGSPTFSQATVADRTCAKIYEDNADTNGAGYIKQTVSKSYSSSVRLQFSYLQQYTGSAPTQKDIKVYAKLLPSGTENLIYSTSSGTYDQWIPVNENIDSAYFPSTGDYEIRFEWDYTTPGSSTAACCFTDCEVILQSVGIKKVTGLGDNLVVNNNFCSLATAGQANTPLKYHEYGNNKYLLMGTWVSTTSGKYYCVDATNGNVKWTFTPSTGAGFYWAGAACFEGYTIFGDDQGNVHVVNLDQSGTAVEVDQDSGTAGTQPYDLTNTKIRTSVCYYDVPGSTTDYLYVADYNGVLYQLTYDSSTHTITAYDDETGPSNYSTSSPVRIDDLVFYGCSGLSVAHIDSGDMGAPAAIGSGIGKVQASPVVYKAGTNNYYIYVTENVSNGRAICVHYYYSDQLEDWVSENAWTFTSNNYILQGFAAANGKLYFGNDSGRLYVLY